jgi:hypothetical protein
MEVIYMVDKVRDCINDLISIADGPKPIGEQLELAKGRIDDLVADADQQFGGPVDLADLPLRDSLANERSKQSGNSARVALLEEAEKYVADLHRGRRDKKGLPE